MGFPAVNPREQPLSQHASKCIEIHLNALKTTLNTFCGLLIPSNLIEVKGLHGEIYPAGFSDKKYSGLSLVTKPKHLVGFTKSFSFDYVLQLELDEI